jgi:spermidine synthase
MFRNLLDRDTTMVAIYVLTVFVSASLLFVVQPMVGKMILPHLGGSSAVWTTCMLFFQAMLVVGYVYAHFLARHVAPRRQVLIHLAIMLVACGVTVPLGVPETFLKTSGHPALWLLLAMLAGIGLPLFVVSTSAPLFQRWFSYTDHPDAEDPYHLYAASNVGSILALLSYPFVVEPTIGLTAQRWTWSAGFLLLAVLAAGAGYLLWTAGTDAVDEPPETARTSDIEWRQRGKWVFWAFIPSSLMLGVTQYMTTDIASMPLLWVLPLGLYLLSFIFVFAKGDWLLPSYARTFLPIFAFVVLAASVSELQMWVLILGHLGMFFLLAMFFHGRLAATRPDKHGLTEFFIWMSVGGALGGLFNSLVAPAILDRPLEYTGVLVVAIAAIFPNPDRIEDPFNPTWFVPAMMAPVALGYLWMIGFWSLEQPWYLGYAVVAVGVGTAIAVVSPRTENIVAAMLLVLGLQSTFALDDVLTYERSFYASYAVFEREYEEGTYRKLSHGTTAHGVQAMYPGMEDTPVGYHHPEGPVGQVMDAIPHDRVAVAGLGAGAMAAYGGPDNHMTFYEIDPAIEQMAREYFTYLEQCGPYCDVILGDARKLLEKEDDGEFDIIFMDAYNSDSVPTHLLTREAVDLYLSKLDEDGVIVFHVSNRYLDVEGVVGGLVEEMGLAARSQIHRPGPELSDKHVYTSAYTVVAREESDLRSIADGENWRETLSADIVWTDNYSNVVSVFDWNT